LAKADIRVDGDRPWDIRVHDDRLFHRVLAEGTLGLGEAYMDGWWDCDDIDALVMRATRSGIDSAISHNLPTAYHVVRAKLRNMQTKRGARKVAKRHYDLDNDLFQALLDPWMQYSCGYFRDTDDLRVAQEQKLDLIARKLRVQPGDHVLDIGCGWGGLARFLAARYGCHVTGVNISEEQIRFAREWCKDLPVEILHTDYRDVRGQFDKVVSVGMFEHVGPKNYAEYMQIADRCLRPHGLFLLHSIGMNGVKSGPDPWLDTYIFPNSVLPTASQIMEASKTHFVIEDWHAFGHYYRKTLHAWHHNLQGIRAEVLRRHGERFYRMWEYYLLTCAGAFGTGMITLWQVVFSKGGVPGGYESVR
jgi:cyclopropane-fatty-acyl-phospholipid synthase